MTGNVAVDDDLGDRVRDALTAVEDPDLGTNAVESGLVTDVSARDGAVTITVDLAGFDEPTGEEVTEALRREALATAGVERATVEGETPDEASEDRLDRPDGVDTVIAVASAKGGVGKTTVSTQLARALSADPRRDVGLFDADIYGPNVPELLDLDGPVSANAEGDAEPLERDGLAAMSVGLIANDAPIAWRGAMAHEAVSELFEDTAWGDLDALVVDLPPGTGDVVLTALQSLPVDGAVLVTTPYPTSVGDTARSAALFEENGVPVLGTVVNMAGFTCDCGREHDLFPDADVEGELDQPVLCELPFDEAVRETDGDVPDAVASLADDVLERLDEQETLDVPDHALDIRGLPPNIRHEQAVEEFRALEPGETFYLVNDHDPSPLASMLAEAVGYGGPLDEAFDRCDVRRRGPDEWVMAVSRPETA
ncbi:P-loop NTPase [Halostella sp. JP-L12]|uniref:P-loop NTPase n=1 Tax=Halostella TaxID=1843185 RepID=UPI000EF82E13|nr:MULTISPECIES: P-loop NTPase [Halostella]NHN49821.1 P-loop NTPase [Halostella sp. JP-L12]